MRRAPRPCLTPRCPSLVTKGGYCADCECRREAARREARGRRVYDGAEWRRVRKAKLARDPFCEMRTHCHGAPANEVHHVDGDQWNLALSNLESACKPCHSAHTAREQAFDRSSAPKKASSSRHPTS